MQQARAVCSETFPPPPPEDAAPLASDSPVNSGAGAGALSPMYDLDRSIDELRTATILVANVSQRVGARSDDHLTDAFFSIYSKLNELCAIRAGVLKP